MLKVESYTTSTADMRRRLVLKTMSTSSTCGYHRALRGIWTAGLSHSSADDSLLKNPVSPFILPTSGGPEEKEDELEDVQEDELGNDDEDELEESHDMMEDELFGQEEELEEGEEAREGKTRALPKGPSAEQMRIHRLTHYPFRSWCPQCVAGRAKS